MGLLLPAGHLTEGLIQSSCVILSVSVRGCRLDDRKCLPHMNVASHELRTLKKKGMSLI